MRRLSILLATGVMALAMMAVPAAAQQQIVIKFSLVVANYTP